MTPPIISVSLTEAQAADFAEIDRREAAARQAAIECPIARQYAARAILLGQYPLAAIDGCRIAVNPAERTLSFVANPALALVPDQTQPEAVR